MPETEGGEKIKQRLLEPGIEGLFKCWLHGYYMPLVRLLTPYRGLQQELDFFSLKQQTYQNVGHIN